MNLNHFYQLSKGDTLKRNAPIDLDGAATTKTDPNQYGGTDSNLRPSIRHSRSKEKNENPLAYVILFSGQRSNLKRQQKELKNEEVKLLALQLQLESDMKSLQTEPCKKEKQIYKKKLKN